MSFPKDWFPSATPNFSEHNQRDKGNLKRKSVEKSSNTACRAHSDFHKVDHIFGNKKPRFDEARTTFPTPEKVKRLPIKRNPNTSPHARAEREANPQSKDRQKEKAPPIPMPPKPMANMLLPMQHSANPYLFEEQSKNPKGSGNNSIPNMAQPLSGHYPTSGSIPRQHLPMQATSTNQLAHVDRYSAIIDLGDDIKIFYSNPPGIGIQKRLGTPKYFRLDNDPLSKQFFDHIANMSVRLTKENRPFATSDEPFVFMRSLKKDDLLMLIQCLLASEKVEISPLALLFLMDTGDLFYKEVLKIALINLLSAELIKSILLDQVNSLEGVQSLIVPYDKSLKSIFNVKIWLSQQHGILQSQGLEAFKRSLAHTQTQKEDVGQAKSLPRLPYTSTKVRQASSPSKLINLGQDFQILYSKPPKITIQKRVKEADFFHLEPSSIAMKFFDQLAHMMIRLERENRSFELSDELFTFMRKLQKEEQQGLLQSYLISPHVNLSVVGFLFFMDEGDWLYKQILAIALSDEPHADVITNTLFDQLRRLEEAQTVIVLKDSSLQKIFNVKIWLSQELSIIQYKGLEAFRRSLFIGSQANQRERSTNNGTSCKSDISSADGTIQFKVGSLKESKKSYQLTNQHSIKFFNILFLIVNKANKENRVLCSDDAKGFIDDFTSGSSKALALLLDSTLDDQPNLSLLSCLFFIDGGRDLYRSIIGRAINKSSNFTDKDDLINWQLKYLSRAANIVGIDGPKESLADAKQWLERSLRHGLHLRWCNLKGKRLYLQEGDEECQVELRDNEYFVVKSLFQLIEKNGEAETIANTLFKAIIAMPRMINFENRKSIDFLSLLLFFFK